MPAQTREAPASGHDPAILGEVAARALGVPGAELLDWRPERLDGGLDSASTLTRVVGRAAVDGQTRGWSAVLKATRRLPDRVDPASAFYWRREALAYTSDVLRDLEGIAVPRCYRVDERDDAVDLWIEHVDGLNGRGWTGDHFLAACRRLGRFAGAYLAGRPLPDYSWLLRDARRMQAAEADPRLARLEAMRGHPLVEIGWPGELGEAVLRFWREERGRFLDALDALPRTLQHGDAATHNMLWRDGDLVVLDWAWTGISPLGEDLSVLANYARVLAPDTEVTDFEPVIDAYTAGIRDAGWRGDGETVRLGCYLSYALRYTAHPTHLDCLDLSQREHYERNRGQSLEQILQGMTRVLRRAVRAVAEARELLTSGDRRRVEKRR